MVTGDEIQLWGTTQKARVVDVDYGANGLTIDKSLTWSAGPGVALAWNGSAPDLGAHEYKPGAVVRFSEGSASRSGIAGSLHITNAGPEGFTFTLREEMRLRILLIDGRVRTAGKIADGNFGRGTHAMRWNAGGMRKRDLASGAYPARIESGAGNLVLLTPVCR